MGLPQRKCYPVSNSGTKMSRIEDAIKETSKTGERIPLSCAEVAFVPRHESDALEQLEQALDCEAISKNRIKDKGKKLVPWAKVKEMLNL